MLRSWFRSKKLLVKLTLVLFLVSILLALLYPGNKLQIQISRSSQFTVDDWTGRNLDIPLRQKILRTKEPTTDFLQRSSTMRQTVELCCGALATSGSRSFRKGDCPHSFWEGMRDLSWSPSQNISIYATSLSLTARVTGWTKGSIRKEPKDHCVRVSSLSFLCMLHAADAYIEFDVYNHHTTKHIADNICHLRAVPYTVYRNALHHVYRTIHHWWPYISYLLKYIITTNNNGGECVLMLAAAHARHKISPYFTWIPFQSWFIYI